MAKSRQRSPDVDAWFAAKGHPQETTMEAVRSAILAADARLQECVKWSCPTFIYEGNFASLNPQAKAYASLLVHTGAKIPGTHPLLEGGGATARYARFDSAADVKAKRKDLERLVRAWCDWKDAA